MASDDSHPGSGANLPAKIKGIPVVDWPMADRKAWEAALVRAQRLRRGGRASHMRRTSQTSLARAYGILLEFCVRNGRLDPGAAAGAHITANNIEALLEELKHRVGSVTRASYINRLLRMGKLLDPDHDVEWLREIAVDLRDAMRLRPKHDRIVDANRLLTLGLDLIDRGETSAEKTNLQRAALVRNGLMVAMLALCPIRLGGFANLTLGKSICRERGQWWIVLEPSQTKSNRRDQRPIAPFLTEIIDRYVEQWRPLFINPQDAFWASIKGGGMAYTYVGDTITRTTARELGTPVNPHLFRDCAVDTIANRAGEFMHLASGLLQHTDPRTTEKHYNKGASLSASKRFAEIIAAVESEGASI